MKTDDKSIEQKIIAKSLTAPHQQRVINEKSDLDEKISALALFTRTEIFANLSAREQIELTAQYHAMYSYSNVLALRIIGFDSNATI